MPISRTATLRAKSPRASARTPTPSNVSTPKFMPPSHYAAAGGYTPQFTNQDTFPQGEHVRSYGKTSATTSNSTKGMRNLTAGGNSSRMSMAAHAPSDSESSLLSNPDNYVPDLNELCGIKNGLPELEAQLLPSLRDTIDRMTGGSRITGTRTGDRTRPHGTTTKGPWSTPTVSEMRDHLGTNADSTRRHYHDTPTISFQSTPTLETSSRLKTPTKSALKSSLRSPSAKISSTVSGTPETIHVASPSPLKSMKTLLTRKYSGKLRSPFMGHKATPDPPQEDPRIHSNDHSSSQQERVSSDKPPSKTSTSGHQSNIPRLRNRFHGGPSNDFYDNDSDLERRFEVESRRKLIVTNAEVLASASSSESTAEVKRNAQKSRAAEASRTKYADSSWSGPIGLGLSLAQTTHTESRVSPQTRIEESRRYLNPGKTLRFSLPPSNSGESTYSDDFDDYDKPNAKNGQIRRQESCVPVDTDLDFNSRHPTRHSFLRHHGSMQQNGSAYFPNPSHRSPSQSPASVRNERDSYSDRRRSSSCGPSFRASPQDTTHHMYHDPPRPRSSCQRHVAREEYTPDSEFPQNLKELIKHRNSSQKPLVQPRDVEQPNYPESTSRQRRSDELDKNPSRKEKPATNSPRDTGPYFYNRSYVRHSREGQEHWTDANSDNESFRSVAIRERLAFGIPPSESDEVFNEDLREPELSHADSDMSSISESIWKQAQDEMDFNSDRILRKLSDKDVEKDKSKNRRYVQGTTPQLNIISPTLSSESLTYEEREAPILVNHGSGFETTGPKFRTTPLTTESNADHQDSTEVLQTREGVIQEIFETEEDLLHLLRICMRLFVIPLRVQNSHTWITGVPPTVARLFDWFDDIVHLHEQIYGALCSARDTMSPATDRVSESLRWFVLRVEVYQPYLVRLADARTEIQGALEDQKCELGQFIRLQEANRECQGWTLERLLMLPVNRLASYQDLFARMLDLTPKAHQDYLSTLSLARSTDIALKVMTEVKAREDEYNLLQQFSSRIQGLPTQNHLATRDRRLLHSGPLQLVISNLHELPCRTGTSPAESKRISRSSTLLDAIAKSPYDFTKSAAVNSGSSWINGNDEGSTISTSSTSKVSWFSRLPLRRRSRAKSPSRVMPITDETAHMAPSVDLRTLDVHAFVFSDLVLLVQQNRSDVPGHSWILSEDVGIFRPLSIARLKRRSAQEGMILSLEVATVDPLGLNDTFNFRTSSWRIVDLLLPPPPSRGGVVQQVDVNSDDHFQPWLNSLRQCCKYILTNLTFITHPNQGESSFLGSDRVLDTHLVISSLTGSGLPIPRSPSGHLPETCSAGGGDRAPGSSDEREERGWWSLRYQQVFREFQRQDSGLLEDEEEG